LLESLERNAPIDPRTEPKSVTGTQRTQLRYVAFECRLADVEAADVAVERKFAASDEPNDHPDEPLARGRGLFRGLDRFGVE